MIKTLITPEEISLLARPCYADEEKALAYIVEAEQNNIKPAIGDDLFIQLKEGGQTFLLEGGVYERNGKRYYLNGIKKALAYFVISRLYESSTTELTRQGAVNRRSEYSDNADERDIISVSRETYAIANRYMEEIERYLGTDVKNTSQRVHFDLIGGGGSKTQRTCRSSVSSGGSSPSSPSANINVVQTLGGSTKDVVSQAGVTREFNAVRIEADEKLTEAKAYTDEEIAKAVIGGSDIDLSDYAKKEYVDDEVQTAKDYTDEKFNSLDIPELPDLAKVAETGDYNDLKNKPSIESDISNAFHITDNNGNVIATIDKSGLSTTDLKIKDIEGNLKSILELVSNSNMDSIDEKYDDTFYITDNEGNVILKVDEKGLVVSKITVSKITSDSVLRNDWQGKVMAIYGDSVAAINNGDYEPPFSLGWKWANYTAQYFNMAKQYGRGIGGQKYAFVNGGGAVSWVTPTGVLINRINDQSCDTWDGTYPSGVTAEMESAGEAIRTRGCLSSWHRITHQFPVSIKDSIDVVLVMCHNDSYDETNWQFVENDTTDTEWAASGSEYYGKINGDYNLATLRGGILSTLMKLQLWMPQAIIVLTTGVSGHGNTGELSTNINSSGLLKIAQAVRDMGKLSSIPVIDTFAADGINGWNRTKYIADTIHPYTEAGGKMLARAVIGGMKTILPNF